MIYYDLKEESQKKSIGNVVARDVELRRIARTLHRQYNNNVLIVGQSGTGKTALLEGFAYQASLGLVRGFKDYTIVKLDNSDLKKLLDQTGNQEVLAYLSTAFNNLPKNTIVCIDDFDTVISEQKINDLTKVFEVFFNNHDVQLLITANQSRIARLREENSNFFQNFEEIQVKESDFKETEAIISALSPAFTKQYNVTLEPEIIKFIAEQTKKISSDKKLPLKAIHFLDECLAHSRIIDEKSLSRESVLEIFAEKTGIPTGQLQNDDVELLENLEEQLSKDLIGQDKAVRIVSDIVRRARMGLRNPNRPMGSFLFLGPSGVGKTELAKLLAKKVYGTERSFTRIDMSEFSEQHTVQRLIGAPPGYVGFEAGGQLTNAIKNQPYSLVLLDEIEKANPRIFDIFLQVFDDGRLSDGQGNLVDFTNSIVIATSNIGIDEIVEAYSEGTLNDTFDSNTLMPILRQHFRTEFLNRFDAIIVFNPLSVEDLLKVAQLEIKKVEQRAAAHAVKFNIDPKVLRSRITSLIDYRIGARPVKRFVEQTCEALIAKKILAKARKK